jgi:hypothetical protein
MHSHISLFAQRGGGGGGGGPEHSTAGADHIAANMAANRKDQGFSMLEIVYADYDLTAPRRRLTEVSVGNAGWFRFTDAWRVGGGERTLLAPTSDDAFGAVLSEEQLDFLASGEGSDDLFLLLNCHVLYSIYTFDILEGMYDEADIFPLLITLLPDFYVTMSPDNAGEPLVNGACVITPDKPHDRRGRPSPPLS